MKKTLFKIAVPVALLIAVGVYAAQSFKEVFKDLNFDSDDWTDYDEDDD